MLGSTWRTVTLLLSLGLVGACGGGNTTGGKADATGGAPSGGAETGGTPPGTGSTTPGTGGGGAGGVEATGGAVGTGGTRPADWGVLHSGPTDKVDLLFTIDNSISMADKQALLRSAVPRLVERLVSPPADAGRAPLRDLHVGIITSSLGGHGGPICSAALGTSFDPTQDDRGELIAPLRGLPSYQDLGFLKFDPNGPAGALTDTTALTTAFTDLVTAAGESGCGYEAPLEAWYRFLVDPAPPLEVVSNGSVSVPQGLNTTLLAQRAEFLRPDSVLVIVVLSDENDCSIRDDGVSWLLATQSQRIPRGTTACATDPNSPCCRSCALSEISPPSGCSSLATDAACGLGPYAATEETLNLRCYEQKRRFGIDFLHPLARYVDALTLPTVFGGSCTTSADCPANHASQQAGTCVTALERCEYRNPIYATNPGYAGAMPRRPDMVYLAGIVGVPWQDIATEASLADGTTLEFLASDALADRWPAIVGDPDRGVPPADPHMRESIDPRTGTNPLTGTTLAPTTAAVDADPINGHEYTATARDDLQYACIFPLSMTRDCTTYQGGCDCTALADGNDRPLCQAPGTATATTTQYYGKAYPGLRHLGLLRALGDRAIVGSVCPKVSDVTEPSYGYNPVMDAVVERIGSNLVP